MKSFQESGLNPQIIKALDDLGFTEPTSVQQKAIPVILESSQDLLAFAQTGTGKTAAFALPIIHKLDPNLKEIQALIISPTRELGLQITNDIELFTKYVPNINTLTIYGGQRIDIQINALRNKNQIIVGTPGRIHDLIRRKKLNLNHIKYLVLDEADEILNMGFKDDLDAILSETPKEKQTLLFSATMPSSITQIAKKYMQNPVEISSDQKNIGTKNVRHQYYMAQAKDRYEALRRLADNTSDIYGIIFCRTRRETQEISDKLAQDHYSAEPLHGDLSQEQRNKVMDRFRKRHTKLLVATDVAARGLDVTDLTHVINYNLPDQLESYIHRSGRTGRAGKTGVSMSIIHSHEQRKISQLEKHIGQKFEKKDIPTGQQICEQQLFKLISRVTEEEVDQDQIEPYLPEIHAKLEGLDREELLKRFFSLEFSRFLQTYKNAPDLNVKSRPENFKKEFRRASTKLKTIEFPLGFKDQISPKRLFGIINSNPSLKGMEVGKINIAPSFTTIEIEASQERAFLAAVNQKGRGKFHAPKRPNYSKKRR
ncbi:DEAD/DEAH box helicase [Candidatus Peregrinibacteria bacterium HGW-Peregrinibacteria-1]|jgi:ATP-dependent RNA helicase DeaD|nr:MAG: DEAD/DEAH box helicase [Candidatus Peregrinibacteria bacterium HGW-Peregrinibacteria-1]